MGCDGVSTEVLDLKVYSYDASGLEGSPLAVVFPRDTEAVSRVLAICHDEGVRVYPRGAGSGRTGGSVPCEPGIVLSFEKMNQILELSRSDLVARVQPGVVTGRLQEEVERLGLFYPPDPASLSFCTIGGNVATCAGGPRAVKYGVTRDYCIGLLVVTPKGEVLRLGGRTMKGVSGYDLVRLMVGSEGTLSVFTEIVLRLIPLPKSKGVMVSYFKDVEDAGLAIEEIFARGIVPRTAEIMDEACSAIVAPDGIPGRDVRVGAILLLEADGDQEEVRFQLSEMEGASLTQGAVFVRVAKKGEEEMIWELRRNLSPAVRRLGFPDKISEDIVVPRGRIPAMLKALKSIERRLGIKIVCFGHAGDGNLHVNILCDLSNEREKAMDAVEAVFREALALSGRISGEHGIGLTKRTYLPWELDEGVLNAMKAIKGLFDPKNILNPNKVFQA